jgi:hypothetical protein
VPGGTYGLLSGQLYVSDDVTVSGAGPAATVIDANGLGRGVCVFLANVTIGGVTIRNGVGSGSDDCCGTGSGGGLDNCAGTVTLSDSSVSDNRAWVGGGIYSGGYYDGHIGTLTLNDVMVRDNRADSDGGGIESSLGQLAISQTTVTGNVAAGGGGGIHVWGGEATLGDSTPSGNSAQDGGGIYILRRADAERGHGGRQQRLFHRWRPCSTAQGQLTISNSTFADNFATFGGGMLVGEATLKNSTFAETVPRECGAIVNWPCLGDVRRGRGPMSLSNVTITDNTADVDGGGIWNWEVLNLSNTVLAGNASGSGQAPDCVGMTPLNSQGYNLIGSTAGCGIGGDTTGNLTGMSPNLGPLQNNGGPTPTHAPLPGSPVVDAGNPAPPGSGGTACEAIDQRGVTRPQGARCDIGAVDVAGSSTPTTTTTTIPPFCTPVPQVHCQPALSGKSSLLVEDRAGDAKDVLGWKWRSTVPMAKTDFGSPTTTTDYALCVYDQSGAGPTLRLAATAPAGGVCGGRSCWSEASSGFRYVDRELTPDGLATIRLQAGEAGAGRVKVRGRGTTLPLPLIPPATVQLQRLDQVACWAATFSAPATNTPEKFKAKAD